MPTGPLLDQFIPLQSLDRMSQTEYDVLIVGSGAGGGAAVWRLCEQWRESGKKIGMIERGPILLQTHIDNLPTLKGKFREYFYNPKNTIPTGNLLPDLPGARQVFALGGRTILWGLTTPRLHISELADFPVPLHEMESYYNIAERMMNVTPQTINPLTQIFLNRLWEQGIPEAMPLPKAINLEPEKYGPVVNFSSLSFLAEAFQQQPFDLAINARAVQIVTENEKVTGVKVMTPDKKAYLLKAKTIILSASTFETPRLLLYSGIKGQVIGHYLTVHSFIDFFWNFKTSLDLNRLPEQLKGVFIIIPQREDHPYQHNINISGTYKTVDNRAEFNSGGWSFGKVEPRFENQVYLDRSNLDEFGIPKIQVRFSYSARDQSVMARIVDDYKKTVAAIGIYPYAEPLYCLNPAGSDFHEAGTCRMGDDPATSATNRYGQIHGVTGLYVADNSVLPTTGAANPTLTTVALAIRTADYIAGVP